MILLLSPIGEGQNAGPDVLTGAHLSQLLNVLKPIATKWKDFGIQLEIDLDELNDIEGKPTLVAEGVRGYMRECLILAIRKHHITKSDICKALRSPHLHEYKMAKDFEETFNAGRK